jgi:hypothetical protein
MHAVIFDVEIVDMERATANLSTNVVPGAAQAPGFVAGYWLNLGNDRGHSVIVFESEEKARAYMDSGEPPPPDLVKFLGAQIVEVAAHAEAGAAVG